MREKKVRGIKRKTNQMIKLMKKETVKFPTEYHKGYWRMLLPVAQHVIASSKTPNKIKRLCIQTLLNQVDHLIRLKPNDESKYRVVALVNLPDLWYSQIIVFKGDSYYKDFFNHNNEV